MTMRVLIVDESPERTAVLREGLERAGHEVAAALFDEHQRLRAELVEANLKLSERKLVERAKGILVKSRGMGEDEAYQALRRMAMDRGKRLGEIAQQVIEMAG